MQWKKLGRIFQVESQSDWMHSHAAVPVAEKIDGNVFRVYFSARDKQNRSRTGFFEFDITAPEKILKVSSSPVLDLGPAGNFDDSGAMLSWITTTPKDKHFYYIGWNLGVTVPFRNSVGLAVQASGSTELKKKSGPVVDRGPVDPCFTASSCVRLEGDVWKMWYLSCERWETLPNGEKKHYYNIKYATSKNGTDWDRTGVTCIPFKSSNEYAISRPSVLFRNGMYQMWYSYRGDKYRIGYAESPDGIHWKRKDEEAGITVSPDGWDSEMIEYPFVFEHAGSVYMLYNGNDYGRTGIGLAVLA